MNVWERLGTFGNFCERLSEFFGNFWGWLGIFEWIIDWKHKKGVKLIVIILFRQWHRPKTVTTTVHTLEDNSKLLSQKFVVVENKPPDNTLSSHRFRCVFRVAERPVRIFTFHHINLLRQCCPVGQRVDAEHRKIVETTMSEWTFGNFWELLGTFEWIFLGTFGDDWEFLSEYSIESTKKAWN